MAAANSEPIAIIGMGLRLPGGISTSEQFWDLLINKKNGKCRVPADRYNVDAFSRSSLPSKSAAVTAPPPPASAATRESQSTDKPLGSLRKNQVATEHGYFLNDINIKHFDAAFFNARPMEVEAADPQQHLLLEVVWECIENAGQTSLKGSDTGVFVGVFGEDWHDMLHKDEHSSSAYRVISAGDFAIANRLSYEFDFRGPR